MRWYFVGVSTLYHVLFIYNYCTQDLTVSNTDIIGTLSYDIAEGSCINTFDDLAIEKVQGFVINNPISVSDSCSLKPDIINVIAQQELPIAHLVTDFCVLGADNMTPVLSYLDFVASYPVTNLNSCNIDLSSCFPPEPELIPPSEYVAGLYQELCTGSCLQSISPESIPSFITYPVDTSCVSAAPSSIPPAGPFVTTPIEGICEDVIPILSSVEDLPVAIDALALLDSCLLDSPSLLTPSLGYRAGYVDSAYITVSNSCSLNALPI